jgi:hypothetical protein
MDTNKNVLETQFSQCRVNIWPKENVIKYIVAVCKVYTSLKGILALTN